MQLNLLFLLVYLDFKINKLSAYKFQVLFNAVRGKHMQSSSTLKAIILLIICAFFWGSCFPIGKNALAEVSPYTLVLTRFVIAAVCLLAYMLVLRQSFGRLSSTQWLWSIIVSIVGVGGLNLCLFTGLNHTQATNGSLIMALSPLLTSLIACLVERQMPSRAQCFSLAVSLFGVMMVITEGDLSRLAHFNFNHGDKTILVGMLCWSSYTYFSKGISRWMPMIPYTFLGMISGAAVIGVVCLLHPEVNPLRQVIQSSSSVLAELIFIGLFGTVAGYLLWMQGVHKLGPATASLFFNLVPVFAALTALGMGQTVTPLQLSGIAIVIIGLLLPRLSQVIRRHKIAIA